MKRLVQKLARLFWGLGFLYLIIMIFTWQDSFQLQSHDTYFIIGMLHIFIPFAFFHFIIGGVYLTQKRRKLNKWITLTHTCIIASYFLFCSYLILVPTNWSHFGNFFYFPNSYGGEVFIIWLGGTIPFIFCQVFFAVHLLFADNIQQLEQQTLKILDDEVV